MKLTPLLRDHLFRPRGWPRVLALRRLVAVALILLAALLALRPQQARDAPTTVPTLVAARDLATGTTLRAGDVRVVRSPESLRPKSALTSPRESTGRVLAGATGTGEPITRLRLVGPEQSRLATGDPDAVAVPVRLADPEVAALLLPGTRVDVVTVARDTGAEPVLLASEATVVTIRPTTKDTADRGRLVVIAVPGTEATRVAAVALEQPVGVTLR